jgi:hypothetical protein
MIAVVDEFDDEVKELRAPVLSGEHDNGGRLSEEIALQQRKQLLGEMSDYVGVGRDVDRKACS